MSHFETVFIGAHKVKVCERADGKILAMCDCGSNTVHSSLIQAEEAVRQHHQNDNDPQSRLQAEVNRAFAEPDYVDTGDLIHALLTSLGMLKLYGIDVKIPDHNED